jgi:hypothetical protein
MRSSLLRNSAKLEQIFLESTKIERVQERRPSLSGASIGGIAAAAGGGLLAGRQYKRGKEAQRKAYKGIKKLNPFLSKNNLKRIKKGKYSGEVPGDPGIVTSRKTVSKRPPFEAPVNTQTKKPFTSGSKAYKDALAANKAKPKAKVNKDKVIKAGKKQGKKLAKHLKGSFWKGARKLFERLEEFDTIELRAGAVVKKAWGGIGHLGSARRKGIEQAAKAAGKRPSTKHFWSSRLGKWYKG